MTTEPILSARGLVKRFGKVTALNGCDFDLMPGEILGVIGGFGELVARHECDVLGITRAVLRDEHLGAERSAELRDLLAEVTAFDDQRAHGD